MTRPTVWAIKEQTRRDASGQTVPMDYSPVYKYGDLRFITSFDPPIYPRVGDLMLEWQKSIRTFLDTIDENDFIVLTGAPIATFVVGVMMGWSGKLPRVLVWRRERNAYELFDVNVQMGALIRSINADLAA